MDHASEGPQGSGELEGRYANYFKIGHNAFEFLFDFGQLYPESEVARFHTRIITSPLAAKALFETLRQSIAQHERRYGVIPEEDV